MPNASHPEILSEIDSEVHSDSSSVRSQPRAPLVGRMTAARERRNRARDRDDARDRRPVPKDIKLKSVPAHLQLADPISQHGRWFF